MLEVMATAIVTGFIAFFATGIDDTIAYTSLYAPMLRSRRAVMAITSGIILATILALFIAYFVSSLIGAIENRHLIGAGILISIGALTLTYSARTHHHRKLQLFRMKNIHEKTGLFTGSFMIMFCLGFAIFFATGLDDIIAYSSLMIAEGAAIWIATGVMLATVVDVFIANMLAHKLEKIKHPERVGGALLILIGVLIAVKIL